MGMFDAIAGPLTAATAIIGGTIAQNKFGKGSATTYDTPEDAAYFGGDRNANDDYNAYMGRADSAWGSARDYEKTPLEKIDWQQAQADYARQSQLADMALAAAQGKGPSAASAQMQANLDQAIASQSSMAASARGGLAQALAQREAMAGAQDMASRAAAQSAMLRAQEQQQAMSLAGQVTGQMRGQSMDQSQADAMYRQRQVEANREATLRQQQLAAQRESGYLNAAQGVAQMQTQSRTQGAINAQNNTAGSRENAYGRGMAIYGGMMQGIGQGISQWSKGGPDNSIGTIFGGGGGGGGGGVAAAGGAAAGEAVGGAAAGGSTGAGGASAIGALISDIRLKTHVEPARSEIEDWLDSLRPYAYEYRKDPGEQHFGVMAQDMARSQMGQTMLDRNEQGYLKIDGQSALSGILAALADINDRMRKMEARRG